LICAESQGKRRGTARPDSYLSRRGGGWDHPLLGKFTIVVMIQMLLITKNGHLLASANSSQPKPIVAYAVAVACTPNATLRGSPHGEPLSRWHAASSLASTPTTFPCWCGWGPTPALVLAASRRRPPPSPPAHNRVRPSHVTLLPHHAQLKGDIRIWTRFVITVNT